MQQPSLATVVFDSLFQSKAGTLEGVEIATDGLLRDVEFIGELTQ